jgi:hypothetical protein
MTQPPEISRLLQWLDNFENCCLSAKTAFGAVGQSKLRPGFSVYKLPGSPTFRWLSGLSGGRRHVWLTTG